MAIEREIHSADRIDLLCAFVRWNGLRMIRPALEAHREAGRPLRVITTVYTGSTERRALDWLASIGADVKVCTTRGPRGCMRKRGCSNDCPGTRRHSSDRPT